MDVIVLYVVLLPKPPPIVWKNWASFTHNSFIQLLHLQKVIYILLRITFKQNFDSKRSLLQNHQTAYSYHLLLQLWCFNLSETNLSRRIPLTSRSDTSVWQRSTMRSRTPFKPPSFHSTLHKENHNELKSYYKVSTNGEKLIKKTNGEKKNSPIEPENLSLYWFQRHQHTVQEQNGEHRWTSQEEEEHPGWQETPSTSASWEHLEL